MLLAFHKPYGVLCQFTPDQPGQRTLADFGFPAGVYPVGRLDMDSEGLLLLCDEPGLNHRLLDPKAGHARTYLAQVEGLPAPDALRRIAAGGLEIQGHRTLPAKVACLESDPGFAERVPPVRFRKTVPTAWISLALTEGKNRQVRRMTAAVGLPTLRLVRVAVGAFQLGDLPSGAWREISASERRMIFSKTL